GLYQIVSEALGGLRVVKAYTAERAEAGQFHRTNKAVVAQEFKVRTARALASPLVEVIALFILGALVLVAVKHIDRGRLDPTGSGITPLLSLIPRLFDPDPGAAGNGKAPHPPGRVLIDGNDIRAYSVRSLRRQIAVVTQETVLFAGTIRSNIAYGASSGLV